MTHLKRINIIPEKYPTREYYPFNLEVFQQTKSLELDSAVTFLIGENGTGKSTLLRAVSRKCGIHIWEWDDVGGVRCEHNPFEKDFYRAIDIEWSDGPVPGSFFGSEIFREFSQLLEEWARGGPGILDYYGGKSLLTQSHGQSIISYCRARYKIKGLYFLDEPETALSPKSQIELLKVMTRMSRKGHAQFVVITHSPVLLACPDAKIYDFNTIPIDNIDYEQTEYYQFYRDFMNDRDKYLKSIISDSE